MKLIHCSDLHLDSKMETNLSQEQARERNRELSVTFLRMVQYARENGVQAVLIAGDLFDTQRITARTAGLVLDTIEKAKEVEFLYLRGNHDESDIAFQGRTLPGNLRLFSDEWTSYSYQDVTITGLELNRENWQSCYGQLKLDVNQLNIVMLHGQISQQPGEEQVCLPLLRNKGIDYLALGHIHSCQDGILDSRGKWCYSGCLEGRGFDECGQKGFVLLETSEHGIRTEFVPFAKRSLWEAPVDITGLTSIPDIRRKAAQAVKNISSCDLVKLVLTGWFTLDTQKDIKFLEDSFRQDFYAVKVKDESRLKIAPEEYEHDISLKGAFIRMVMASDMDEEEKSRVICCGIQALSGEEITL